MTFLAEYAGDYTGYFYCEGIKYTSTLSLHGTGGLLLAGTLEFTNEAGNVTGKSNIGGAVGDVLLLVNVNWIVDPGFQPRLTLTGTLDTNAGILSGTVASCNTENFSFAKDPEGTRQTRSCYIINSHNP